MKITTTSTLPEHEVLGVVTASVNCIREYLYEFHQGVLDELMEKLEEQANKLGADAVIGVTIQLQSPVLGGNVRHSMTAFGTAIKTV